MRIHQLKLRGIGPFVEEYTLDFDALSERKLFLIEGVTGSGKSTIIDAIVYALYGSVTEGMSEDRLVSDFLTGPFTPADRPYVELVFSVESGVYRVRREPKYDYVNRNGNPGTRNPEVRVEKLANERALDGELIANRVQEVTREVENRLQLDRQQFHSTVVLAQGRFAKFLQATSDEREKILERVFGTGGYTRVQQVLEARRKDAKKARESAVTSLRDAASRFVQAAGLPGDSGEWVDSAVRDPEAALVEAGALVADLEDRLRAASERAKTAGEAAGAARDALKATQDRAGLVSTKRRLLEQDAQLAAKAADVEGYREQVALHERADAATPAVDSLRKAEKKEATAAVGFAEALERLADEDLASLGDEELGEAVRGASALVQADLGRLEEPARLEAKLPSLEKSAREAAEEEVKAAAVVASVEQRREELPAAIAALDGQIGELSQAAGGKADRAKDLDEFRGCLKAAQNWADLAARNDALASQAVAAQSALDKASQHVGAVEGAYTQSLAGQVALALEPDEPCPVCGSREHPNPATGGGDVDRQAVLDAREAEAKARRALDSAREAVGAAEVELASAKATAKDQDAAYWRSRVSDAEAALKAAQKAEKDLLAAQKQRADLEAESASVDAARDKANAALSDARTGAQQAAASLSSAEATVQEARDGHPTVAARVVELGIRRDRLGGVQAAHASLAGARAALAAAQEGLAEALRANGFQTREERDASLLTATVHATLSADIKDHDLAVQRTRDGLADPKLVDLDADEVVDVVGPEAVFEAAAVAEREAVGARATAKTAHDSASERFAEVAKAIAKHQVVRAETAPVLRMADVATGYGDNRLGIPLASYVVMRRFGEVVEAANERLQTISDSRYQLEASSDAREGRKRTRGLGLRIVDGETEKARDVKTLSGGETFYTSLSLALGLADVVQAEAGGVRLGTLFIDEGFGSLDGDTLDKVMDVLGHLTRGDRVVGVISHVEEMKRAIADRVKVTRRADGSSVIDVPQ